MALGRPHKSDRADAGPSPFRLQLLSGIEGWGQGAVAQAVQQGIGGRQLLQVPVCEGPQARGHT